MDRNRRQKYLSDTPEGQVQQRFHNAIMAILTEQTTLINALRQEVAGMKKEIQQAPTTKKPT